VRNSSFSFIFHLIIEGLEVIESKVFFSILLLSILGYLIIEKFLKWRHCHECYDCKRHGTVGFMNLIGDSIHNFLDGMIIAGSFVTGINFGIATTFSILLHEIPQEIGDFSVLVYSGTEKKKALLLNLLVSLSSLAGGLVGFFLSEILVSTSKYMIPVAAGGFIYISLSDLIPEILEEKSKKKFLINFIFLVLGVFLMSLTSE